VGVVQVLVNRGDESSRRLLSLLKVSLGFRSEILGETSLGLNSKISLGFVVVVGSLIHSSENRVMGVKDFHSSNVLQWVLLLSRVEGFVSLLGSQSALDSIGVDDLGNIRVGQHGSV